MLSLFLWAASQPQPLWLQFLNSTGGVALIGTVFGGIAIKLVDKWLSRGQEGNDLRSQLVSEINGLQTRLDKVEEEVTLWRTRFYEEQEKAAMLRIQLVQAGHTPIDHMTLNLHLDPDHPTE